MHLKKNCKGKWLLVGNMSLEGGVTVEEDWPVSQDARNGGHILPKPNVKP